MPLFVYKCECEKIFEEIYLPWQPQEIECPKCGSKKVEKQLGAPNLRFKGKGFYSTDYKKGKR